MLSFRVTLQQPLRKILQNKCHYYDVTLVEAGDRGTLGDAIGKEQRVVLAVLDEGFAEKITH